MRNRNLIALLLGMVLLAGCSGSAEDKAVPGDTRISYQDAFPGVTFTRPVFLGEVPGKPNTFLILEQPGAIQIVSPDGKGTGWSKSEFARFEVTGGESDGDERGLLGFAFHPGYAANRKYYVYFVKASQDVLSEGVADTSLIKDAGAPLRQLFSIPDPFPNHNGGTLAFGPKDGFLYIGIGDGGSAGDPFGNGQNKNALLGKFLRIDVDSQAGGKPYAIPADNPFLDGSGAPEVWAYGMRNPWKWSFDSATGDLWAGDVGQNRLEEVDLIEKGGNYGWNAWEGNQCYPAGGTACDSNGYKFPVYAYGRDAKGGISVTGGVVYRGKPASPFFGTFIFGDYGTNNVWSLTKAGQASPLAKPPAIGISSFNADSHGNVYVMGVNSDTIYRMEGF